MKNYGILALLFFSLFLSCSKDNGVIEPDEEPEPEVEVPESLLDKVSMQQTKASVNIFENLRFEMVVGEDGNPFNTFVLVGQRELYDSIVWSIPELYHHKSVPSSVMGSVERSFAKAGKYRMTVSFYKTGKVIKDYFLPVEVRETKDFLNIRWAEKEKNVDGFFNSDGDGYSLELKYHNTTVQYATLTMAIYNASKELSFEQRVENIDHYLADYLTDLYGKAVISAIDQSENVELLSQYDKAFHNKPVNARPVALWYTVNSQIALLEHVTSIGSRHYSVIAEQRAK